MKAILFLTSAVNKIFLFVLPFFFSTLLNAQEVIFGDTASMGNGILKAWIKTDALNRPVSVGVSMTDDALVGLTHESAAAHLDLPENVPGNLIDHVFLNWNPHGHPPAGIYDSAHFDVHFYMISKQERLNIQGGPDPVPVNPELVPSDYVSDPGGVPQMGTHWVDTTSAEFHGEDFTQTFIYGYTGGRLCFYEPMITKAWLESEPDFAGSIKQPSVFQKGGYYPAAYKIYHDTVNHAYNVELTDFVLQKPVITEIPSNGLQLWLKADAGVMSEATTINRWMDQSGNGNDVIQSVSGRQPFLVSSELNGKPVVRFDGEDDRLGFTGSTPMDQISLFLVFKNKSGAQQSDPTLPGFILNLGPSGAFVADEHLAIKMRGFTDDDNTINIGTGDPTGLVKATATGIAVYDEWRNISVVRDRTLFNTTLRWNGTDALITTIGLDGPVSVPLGDPKGSGGGLGSTDNFPGLGTVVAKCDIAELIVYDTVLSEDERTSVEHYLAEKYNLLVVTGTDNQISTGSADGFALHQNYPNPFSTATTFEYRIPQPSRVTLQVFDVLGRQVIPLVDEEQAEGIHEVEFNRGNLPDGLYYYRLTAGSLSDTKKLLIGK